MKYNSDHVVNTLITATHLQGTCVYRPLQIRRRSIALSRKKGHRVKKRTAFLVGTSVAYSSASTNPWPSLCELQAVRLL